MRRALGVFCTAYAIYVACPIATTFDSKWLVPTVLSVLREGNLDLDEYAPSIAHGPHGPIQVHGHWYNTYPLGPAVLALPFIAGFDGLCRALAPLAKRSRELSSVIASWRANFDATGEIDLEYWNTAQRLIASAVVAFSAGAFFIVCGGVTSQSRALVLASIFALCTSCLSTASRALWQHGPSLLFLTLALLALVRARTQACWLWLAGVATAMSYLMRPTNSIAVVFISAYVLLIHRQDCWKYLVGAILIGAPWVALNLKLYRALLPPYYLPTAFLFVEQSRFSEGLAGTLISPARGLLTFSPIFLFVPWGLWMKARTRTLTPLDVTLASIIGLHWLTIASSVCWWGGHCYGPRMFSDMVPFLMYLLIPVTDKLGWRGSPQRRWVTASFATLAVLSFVTHLPGATSWPAYQWNSEPVEVGTRTARLWEWADLQPLRGVLRHR